MRARLASASLIGWCWCLKNPPARTLQPRPETNALRIWLSLAKKQLIFRHIGLFSAKVLYVQVYEDTRNRRARDGILSDPIPRSTATCRRDRPHRRKRYTTTITPINKNSDNRRTF